ncbi:hypothetical protein BDI4_290153 [Burkholderia diffusa]|nr:hypothetical protein BDI4_290153 [Burkholderia diffusa]
MRSDLRRKRSDEPHDIDRHVAVTERNVGSLRRVQLVLLVEECPDILGQFGEEFHADGFRIRAHHLLGRGHAGWSFVHGRFSSRFNNYQPRARIYARGESLDFVSVVLTAHALLRTVRCRLLHLARRQRSGRLLYLRALFPGPR